MSKIDDNLSEILNIEPEKKQEVIPVQIEPQNDTQTDYDLSRQTIRNLVRKGEEALDELLFVAKQSESPRAYEVVAGMIKNISDVTKELIDLQKKMKDLNETTTKMQNGVNVQNAVFVGSTAELQKLLRQNKEQNNG